MIARLFLPRSAPLAPAQHAPDAAAEGATAFDPPSSAASSTFSAEAPTQPVVRMSVPVRLIFKLKPPLSMR